MGALRAGQAVQIFQGQRGRRIERGQLLGHFLDEGHRFAKRGDAGMRAEDLFQQRRAAARMAAQKSEPGLIGRAGIFTPPALDGFRRQAGQQFPAAAIRAVVILFHFRHVGGRAQHGLGLAQPFQSFGMLAELIQHDGELLAARVFYVHVGRPAPDQVAQQSFGFRILPAAMQQQRFDAQNLRVLRLPGDAGFDTFPGVVQPALALIPIREAQLRVDGSRIRRHRFFKATARLVQPAQPVILLAEQNQQRDIFGRQLHRALAGLIRRREIQFFARRKTHFKPQLGKIGKRHHQFPISLQRLMSLALEQLLLGFLPTGQVAGGLLQCFQVVGHVAINYRSGIAKKMPRLRRALVSGGRREFWANG